MTYPTGDPSGGGRDDGADGEAAAPVVRDRRRLDPQTGQVRAAYAAIEPDPPQGGDDLDPATRGSNGAGRHADGSAGSSAEAEFAQALAEQRAIADERLADLQRLQAEYVNYRRRVERDRTVAADTAVAAMLEALLPVLDDIHLARRHGDLEGGPFAAIADKLDATLARVGLSRYGDPGETFDPTVHEALVHTEAELAAGTTETTVVEVLQPGYRVGTKVLRAARVAVADPS